eukprot:TRINITY_DN15649_c0_g1_i1.p1 TRINITY_DN15649_c0_g1~~TRINITY_DN15649_c0_g1_i1.p1  ORF type:complete len:298 (+),score=44.45 TRINITY_DN15649_c0_g1_i1:160-1053(+)
MSFIPTRCASSTVASFSRIYNHHNSAPKLPLFHPPTPLGRQIFRASPPAFALQIPAGPMQDSGEGSPTTAVDYRWQVRPFPLNLKSTAVAHTHPRLTPRELDFDEGAKYRVPLNNLEDPEPGYEIKGTLDENAETDWKRVQNALPRIEGIFRMRNTIIRVVDPFGFEVVRRHGGLYAFKSGSAGIRQKIDYATGLKLTVRTILEARNRYPAMGEVDVVMRGYSAARSGFIEGLCQSGVRCRSLADATMMWRNPFRPRPPIHIRFKKGGHYFYATKKHKQVIGYTISRFALFATPLCP